MSDSKNGSFKRAVLVVIGTLVSLIFLYLAFRDISLGELISGLKKMKPIYLIPATGMMLLVQLLRSLRFKLIVSNFCKITLKQSWDILNIWAAASMIMPARLGELTRPYLLQQCGSSFTSGIGAIMVERFFDLSGLLLLLGIVLWQTPEIPAMYSMLGLLMLVGLGSGYVVILLMLGYRSSSGKLVQKITSLFPEKAAIFLNGIFEKLLDGFGVMANFKRVLALFAYSVTLWVVYSSLTYLFLLSFSIEAPFLVAVTIQVFICFGVALPSAPGFIGTFHAAGRYALALFGIQAITAVSFATVYHLFGLLMCLALGTLSYFTSQFTFDQKLFSQSQSHEPHVPIVTERVSS